MELGRKIKSGQLGRTTLGFSTSLEDSVSLAFGETLFSPVSVQGKEIRPFILHI